MRDDFRKSLLVWQNVYFLQGIEFIVKAHCMKNDRFVVNIGHLKMIVNVNNKLTHIYIPTRKESDIKHEDEIITCISNHDKVLGKAQCDDQLQANLRLQTKVIKEGLKKSFSNDVLA